MGIVLEGDHFQALIKKMRINDNITVAVRSVELVEEMAWAKNEFSYFCSVCDSLWFVTAVKNYASLEEKFSI